MELAPPASWKSIATGLDRAPNRASTFTAADFDTLYDSPILMGNQELLQFMVKGVPHDVAVENVAPAVDRPRMLADLKRMVETATQLMGEVPYTHYTFLMIGTGNGGVEHLNSASILFNGNSLGTPDGYLRWLSYVAHEYFHNFNVKRIRPLALGPFDYETENQTNMLWVSEGLSVYYQDLLLVRAGLMTRDQYLTKIAGAIAKFENASGHRYQSATESSWTTWGTSGVGGDCNTTISRYDNGGLIGAMLDLCDSHRKPQQKVARRCDARGLPDVLQSEEARLHLTPSFAKRRKGPRAARSTRYFPYASSTKEPDYSKYLVLADLENKVHGGGRAGGGPGVNVQARRWQGNCRERRRRIADGCGRIARGRRDPAGVDGATAVREGAE